MANGLPGALTHPGWNLPSAAGGGGARGSVWGGKADLSSIQHLSWKAICPWPKPLKEACFLFPSFLFMGKREWSAVMQTGKDWSPEKCDYFHLMIIEKTSNVGIYKNLEHNAIQILQLHPLSQSLANLPPSTGRWNSVISPKFLHGQHLFIWIWGGKSGLYVPSPALYWDSPALIVQYMKHY